MLPIQVIDEFSTGFVHRRIIRAVGEFARTGPVGAATSFITGGGGGTARDIVTATRSDLPAITSARAASIDAARLAALARGDLKEAAAFARELLAPRTAAAFTQPIGGPCIFPFRKAPDGTCKLFVGDQPGPNGGGDPVGEFTATAGAFGMPAMVPMSVQTVTHRCPPGMVLGRDNLCYPRQVLRRDSKFRKWRPGPRPWGTPGQISAVRKAKSFITSGREKLSTLGVTVRKK
jgi:hypothetical protein